MKGLICKELLMTIKHGAIVLVIILLYMVMGIVDPSSVGVLLIWIPFFLGSLPISTIAYDEKDHWDLYALTLPVDKRTLVISKYLMCLILSAVSVLLLLVALVLQPISSGESFGDISWYLLIISPTIGLLPAVFLLPLYYRFGAAKARIVFLGFMMFFIAASMIVTGGSENFSAKEPFDRAVRTLLQYFHTINGVCAVLLAVTLILGGLSVLLSICLYGKEEG